ncbi:hypothetical protein AB0368_07090 [Actinoplanes sp. NPDC051475]|uniref:hypothetical protein n=1 Tax=Actinoplanes sp. NPDC051475 TaxID=3157225 RepID=UPI00344F731A
MAPPPDKDQVTVAYEAIEKDVYKWVGIASVMENAAQHAKSLGLTGFEIGYIPMENGVGEKYNQVQETMISMLTQGAAAMHEIADALIKVREDYERTDQGASHGVHKAGGQGLQSGAHSGLGSGPADHGLQKAKEGN